MPPPVPSNYWRQYTLTAAPVEGISLGRLSVRFGETPLQKVSDTIGVGTVQGEQAFVSWLCYRWNSGTSQFQLWLRNGTLSDTVGTAILKAESPPIEANCSELPEDYRSVALLNGLKIGDNPADIQAKIGRKSYFPRDSKDAQVALIYRDVISGCSGSGLAIEGSLYIESRRQAVYSLTALKDPGSC